MISYDYNKWDDLLEKKALTSPKVTEAIRVNVSLPDIKKLIEEANEIATEIGLTYLQKKQLKKSIENLHIELVGFPSSLRLKVRTSIRKGLNLAENKTTDLNKMITEVEKFLSRELKDEIGHDDDVRSQIIYEIITGDL